MESKIKIKRGNVINWFKNDEKMRHNLKQQKHEFSMKLNFSCVLIMNFRATNLKPIFYWESAWERDFDAGDEKKTHVFSMFSEFAGVNFKHVDSVFMFKQQDNFKGYVILTDTKEYFVEIKGTNPDIKKPGTLISNSIGQVGVGSNWDVKELIFRDWGGVVTTDDKGHLSVMWHKVQSEFKVACIVVGPNGKIVTEVCERVKWRINFQNIKNFYNICDEVTRYHLENSP